jgi:hypothetical protein
MKFGTVDGLTEMVPAPEEAAYLFERENTS